MNNSKQYKEFLKRLDGYSDKVRYAYQHAIDALVKLGVKVRFNPDKPFQFSDYKNISPEANQIIRNLYKELYSELKGAITNEWDLENGDIDSVVDRFLKTNKTSPVFASYYARNNEALKAFFSRKNAHGLNLSSRVWKLTTQFKNEIELAIDTALIDGTSATKLAKEIREYLDKPDMLFRRVRNNRGELVLSKRAKGYNPGRGVYRSSYKNALRVARTEINMSYRGADMNRWSKLDFVIGYEVRRSNREYDCDICALFAGKYPKWFDFTGWHPNCLCYAVPILLPMDVFNKIQDMKMKGEDPSSELEKYLVKDIPVGLKGWVKDNSESLERSEKKGTSPFWVRDNKKTINKIVGLA